MTLWLAGFVSFLRKGYGFILGLCVLLSGIDTEAHPISMSSVSINLHTNGVTLEIKVMVEDLVLFQGLKPNEEHIYPRDVLLPAANTHEDRLRQVLILRDGDGNRMEGSLSQVDTTEIPEQGVHATDLMAFWLRYVFEFKADKPLERLTLWHQSPKVDSSLPSVMNLVVLREGTLIEEPSKLEPEQAHVVVVDWSQAPQAIPSSWRDRREMKKEKQREALGITSYGTVYSFVYIEEREVRHEILIPLLTLEQWIQLDRQNPDFIEVEEQQRARERVPDFFMKRSTTILNGMEVSPKVDAVRFFGVDSSDFAQVPEDTRMSVYTARVGIILSYPAESFPESVRLTWEVFDERTPYIRTTLYSFDQAGESYLLFPDRPTLEWDNQGRFQAPVRSVYVPPDPPVLPKVTLPVFGAIGALSCLSAFGLVWFSKSRKAGLFLAGFGAILFWAGNWGPNIEVKKFWIQAPELELEEKSAIFKGLHQSVYEAFPLLKEESIYNALEKSVQGDLLETLYLTFLESLKIREQGGAVSKVEEIQWEMVDPTPFTWEKGYPRFDVKSTWTVRGTVEHWGHVHRRVNRYEGTFTLVSSNQGWRIGSMKLGQEERLKVETSLRDLP